MSQISKPRVVAQTPTESVPGTSADSKSSRSYWHYIALAGVAGLAVSAGYWFYKRRSGSNDSSIFSRKVQAAQRTSVNIDTITVEKLAEILDAVAAMQVKMKAVMDSASKTIREKALGFEESYEVVAKMIPEDPLSRYGLSTGEFDRLLEREQHNALVRDKMSAVVAADITNAATSSGGPELSTMELIAIHEYMLQELDGLLKEYSSVCAKRKQSRQEALVVNIVAITMQVIVASKVETKFQRSPMEIESAVTRNFAALSSDSHFNTINYRIQRIMADILEIPKTSDPRDV